MTQHYPATIHLECIHCGARLLLYQTRGHLPQEVDRETLEAVVAMPLEDD